VGHKEVPGRPQLYASTKEFLDDFNLSDLSELPDIDTLDEDDERTAETAINEREQ
jgi:segregation and condensation protein B